MNGIGRLIDGYAAAEPKAREQLGELLDLFVALEDDARELVMMRARRLMIGQRQYGRFDASTDRRNFVREALEEAIDGGTYLDMGLMRLLRALKEGV